MFLLKNNQIVISDDKKIFIRYKDVCLKNGINIIEHVYCEKNIQIKREILERYFQGSADIVLIMKNSFLQYVTKELHHLEVFSLYVYPYDIQLNCVDRIPSPKRLIHIDNQKPRLGFLDIEISEHCNLKCKGCLDFSNLVRNKTFLDLNQFRNNLFKLKELMWGVAIIHLQGGEPLLNPDFLEYVKITHEIFPDCDIHILTNGLLINSIDISKLEALKTYNCTLNISQYPITRKINRKIKQNLNASSVVYTFSLPKYIFAKKILLKPHKHPEISYKNCAIKRCTGMERNYISPCMFPLHIYKFNKEFGFDLPETDKMDINKIDVDGWTLIETLENRPMEFCSYCYYGLVPFLWKQRKPSEVKFEDWIVESKYINSKFLPLFFNSVGMIFFKIFNALLKVEAWFHKR